MGAKLSRDKKTEVRSLSNQEIEGATLSSKQKMEVENLIESLTQKKQEEIDKVLTLLLTKTIFPPSYVVTFVQGEKRTQISTGDIRSLDFGIGRAEGNKERFLGNTDIAAINDYIRNIISRTHGKITFDATLWWIYTNKSANGTYLKRKGTLQKLNKEAEPTTRLQHNDVLIFAPPLNEYNEEAAKIELQIIMTPCKLLPN